MLNLQVKAKNYQELKNTLNDLVVNLFEFDEKGFFDDGQNEWAHKRGNYSLECSDVDGRPFPEEDTYNSINEPEHENEDPKSDFSSIVQKVVSTITVPKGKQAIVSPKGKNKNNKKNKKK